MFQEIKASLQQLYREDARPWQVGFSGDVGPSSARPRPMALRPYNTVLAIRAIAEMIEGTLDRRCKFSERNGPNIDANLLKPLLEESFWVNIIGRGYPPPNRVFRWCTQWLKIDPVNALV
jgi:DNA sulfur modification protein DndC